MNTANEASGEGPRISRILVATDFSAQARHALDWAHYLADGFGARVVLFHVIDIFSLPEMACAGEAGIDPRSLLREQADRCMKELATVIPGAETVIREASPRPAIVDAALELNCQLIVMGTHGRAGLAHLLMGIVAEYVVRSSPVPVLTVRMHPTPLHGD